MSCYKTEQLIQANNLVPKQKGNKAASVWKHLTKVAEFLAWKKESAALGKETLKSEQDIRQMKRSS